MKKQDFRIQDTTQEDQAGVTHLGPSGVSDVLAIRAPDSIMGAQGAALSVSRSEDSCKVPSSHYQSVTALSASVVPGLPLTLTRDLL